jgi:hypothetical protein
MREAEIAVTQHTATPELRRRVDLMDREHTRAERRRVWMELDAAAGKAAAEERSIAPDGRRLPWRRTGAGR